MSGPREIPSHEQPSGDSTVPMARPSSQERSWWLVSLAMREGKVCFNMFATKVGDLLRGSNKVRNLISNAYPFIILDEFQDTNSEQWSVVKALGVDSTLIALADPEQRIFDFIGADRRLVLVSSLFTVPYDEMYDSQNLELHMIHECLASLRDSLQVTLPLLRRSS